MINLNAFFQIVASYLTFIFHKVVYRHAQGVVGYVGMSSLQIYY